MSGSKSVLDRIKTLERQLNSLKCCINDGSLTGTPGVDGAYPLFLEGDHQTTDATPSTEDITLPADEAALYAVTIMAKSGTDYAAFHFNISVKDVGGTATSGTQIGTTTTIHKAVEAALGATDSTVSVPAASNVLRLTFQGIAATTIDWEYRIVELQKYD